MKTKTQPFQKSPFKVVMSDKSETEFLGSNYHAVMGDGFCLHIGTMTGTNSGDAFTAKHTFAASAWLAVQEVAERAPISLVSNT